MSLDQVAIGIAEKLIENGLNGIADRITKAASEKTIQEIGRIRDLHKGQRLKFIVSNVNDEATVSFEGLTHTSRLNGRDFETEYIVGVTGESAIYFEIINGTGMPGANEWYGAFYVKDAQTGEPIITFSRRGDDGWFATWNKRSWIWHFNVV